MLTLVLFAMMQQTPLTTGTHGMVSSAHPDATAAGIAILEKGGNAFDAAVAVAAALNVVEPAMSGMGGYGTTLIYDAETRTARFLNSSGRIPMLTNSDAMRPPTPEYLENRRGAKAVSTPGNVNAWDVMHREYGRLPWTDILEPAIRLARDGVVLDSVRAGHIRGAWSEMPAHVKAFYGKDDKPLGTGETLIQSDLANTLQTIARDGVQSLHGGPIGRAIDAAMQETGGFLRLQDLTSNKAEWWEPIAIDYKGVKILTASPPANSFDALVRVGMMGEYDLKKLKHNSPAYLHRFAEVTKHGFWVRLRWAGDPDLNPPPLDDLLTRKYFRDQVAKIDTARASVFEPPFKPAPTGDHTTHFVVADKWGNVVSMTQTLGNLFGSRIMVPGTGIWLNNSLAYATYEPKGNPMDAIGGRRKLSGDVPVIVMKDDRPWIAIGTPGGHTIGQTVPQMLLNMLEFDMNVQDAISAPRISFAEPNNLQVERWFPQETIDALRAKGHNVVLAGGLGNAHGLTIEYNSRGIPIRFTGGYDPRGFGKATGMKDD